MPSHPFVNGFTSARPTAPLVLSLVEVRGLTDKLDWFCTDDYK